MPTQPNKIKITNTTPPPPAFVLHITLKQIQPCCIFSLWSPCIMYTVYSKSVPVLNCILHYNKFFNASWHTVKKLYRKSGEIGSKVKENDFLKNYWTVCVTPFRTYTYCPWSSPKFFSIEYDDFFWQCIHTPSLIPQIYKYVSALSSHRKLTVTRVENLTPGKKDILKICIL